jgi:hypothetical protein
MMKDNKISTPQELREIQNKCRETFTSLTNITEELRTYGFQNTTQEVKSYTKYFFDLGTMMQKIDNIVDAEQDEDLRDNFFVFFT